MTQQRRAARDRKNIVRRGIWLIAAAMLALPSLAQGVSYGDSVNQAEQADPPSQVARVSVLLGNVSVQPAGAEFNNAELNYPMTTGDRLYADAGANAELQTGLAALRLGQRTDLSVTSLTDALQQFGLAQGSLHLRSYALDSSQVIELDTPNVAVTVLAAGDVRVDVDPNSDVTVVSVLSGQAQVDGNGVEQVLGAGERAKFGGSSPVYAQWLGAPRQDGLDRFATDRDQEFQASLQNEQQDLGGDTIGAADLNANGDWQYDNDFGNVWFPTTVAAGWQPYTCGHWTYVSPWGWTWVECESWGFAPFHYGRWNNFGGRWGWIPGPRGIHPVYSPAQVVFVVGRPIKPGIGVTTAWIPLGPREVYKPWYATSGRYVNRVNVTNIYTRNTTDVRRIYDQRTTVSIYANAGGGNGGAPGAGGFANRNTGTVMVSQETFAKGRRVEAGRVPVDGRQMSAAPVLARPQATPDRQAMARAASQIAPGGMTQRPAAPMPPRMAPPMLATRTDVRGQRGVGNAPPQGSGQPAAGGRPGGNVYSGGNAPVERQQPPAARGGSGFGQGTSVGNNPGPGQGNTGYGQPGAQAAPRSTDSVRQPIAPNIQVYGGPRRPEPTAETPAPRQSPPTGQTPAASQVAPQRPTPIAPNIPVTGAPRRPDVDGQQRSLYDRGRGPDYERNGQLPRQPQNDPQNPSQQGSPFQPNRQPERQPQRQMEPAAAQQQLREQQRVQPAPVVQPQQPVVQPQQPRIQTEQPRVQPQPRVGEPVRSSPTAAPAAPKVDSTQKK